MGDGVRGGESLGRRERVGKEEQQGYMPCTTGNGVGMREEMKETNLIQIVQTHEAPLTLVAIIWWMFFIFVLLQSTLVLKDTGAGIAGEPMLPLLMLQAASTIVRRPASPTPAAFDLIGVLRGVVKMIAHAIAGKGAAAAGRHDGWKGNGLG